MHQDRIGGKSAESIGRTLGLPGAKATLVEFTSYPNGKYKLSAHGADGFIEVYVTKVSDNKEPLSFKVYLARTKLGSEFVYEFENGELKEVTLKDETGRLKDSDVKSQIPDDYAFRVGLSLTQFLSAVCYTSWSYRKRK